MMRTSARFCKLPRFNLTKLVQCNNIMYISTFGCTKITTNIQILTTITYGLIGKS